MHIVLYCQYAAVGEDPREGAQKGKKCSVHIFNHSLNIISSSCRHELFLFPFHKHLSEFIWLNVCWEQMPRLCCLPWVPNLTWVQECAHAYQRREIESPVFYLDNYNQSHSSNDECLIFGAYNKHREETPQKLFYWINLNNALILGKKMHIIKWLSLSKYKFVQLLGICKNLNNL